MSYQVAGQTIELELPRLVVRHDLACAASEQLHAQQTARRVVAAALMLCAPSAARKTGLRYHGDVLAYGGDALEYLFAQGASVNEIVLAGNAALQLCIDSIASDEDRRRARGNSEAPMGRSSESGDGSPAGGGAPTPTG